MGRIIGSTKGKRKYLFGLAVGLVVLLSSASVALAIQEYQANGIAFGKARDKAACGQGYWLCTSIVVDCVNTGTNRAEEDQWDCSVIVSRQNAADNNRQTCHVVLGIDPYGEVVYGPNIYCWSHNAGDVTGKHKLRSHLSSGQARANTWNHMFIDMQCDSQNWTCLSITVNYCNDTGTNGEWITQWKCEAAGIRRNNAGSRQRVVGWQIYWDNVGHLLVSNIGYYWE